MITYYISQSDKTIMIYVTEEDAHTYKFQLDKTYASLSYLDKLTELNRSILNSKTKQSSW